ncbi:hypothetical protein HMPREF1400_00885 [Helicobacter pylori GAM119Bi]|nr:hypothetical protein HMPREF1400_00885 [Helicobacter pylori GAM119Bi]
MKAKLSPNINLKKPMSLAFGRFTILKKSKKFVLIPCFLCFEIFEVLKLLKRLAQPT